MVKLFYFQLRHRLIRLKWGMCGILLSILPNISAAPIDLPDMSASSDSIFTPAEEGRLGRIFMWSVRQALPVIGDQFLADYINALGQRLLSKSNVDNSDFYFFLINKPEINAFAGPGRNIGVYSGLVLASESESELAAVLAHEITHVTQHHLTRAFEDASNMTIPTAALLLAAILVGAAGGGNAGVAAAAGVQAAALQRRIDFTRENEKEADALGIQILAAADFDPHAMPIFFERLTKASRLYANNAPEFLMTHPVTVNRIADAMGRADKYPYHPRPDGLDYFLIRAALREQGFSDPKQAVAYFRATLTTKRYRQEAGERFGYALALLRARQFATAHTEIQLLLKQAPIYVPYLLLDARIDAENNQLPRAIKTLSTALELFPTNAALASEYARLSIRSGQAAQAAAPLDNALEQRKNEPSLYELRAQVAVAAGQHADAYMFLSEAYFLNGQTETAVQQLEAALRTEHFDKYADAKLRSRLEELKIELKNDKITEKWGDKKDERKRR